MSRDLLAPQFNTFFTVSFSFYLTSETAMAILTSLPLLHCFRQGSTIYMLWAINPVSNPYLSSLCLNTCLGLSLVLLLLKPTNSSAWPRRSQQWREDQHCPVCSHLRQIFILCSCLPVSKFCLSFSEASLHSFPSVYSEIQKADHCCPLSIPSSYLYCCLHTLKLIYI